MKLTAILLTVACIHVSARSYEQTVSFSGKNVPLQSVLLSFEKQTGLSFFFNYRVISKTKPVTISITNLALETALTEVLNGEDLGFYRAGKTIFIIEQASRSNTHELASISSDSQKISVRGRVVDQNGAPLTGASVIVKGSKIGTVSDEHGVFVIKNISVGTTIIISYNGFYSREIEVTTEEISPISLSLSNSQLDATQVIAYGSSTIRQSTGSVATVSSKDIGKQPVTNPLLTLEGRVPGLFITQTNGMPGAGVTSRIEGQNSISNGNDPFYVVDGVPYTAYLLSNLEGSLGSSGFGSGTGSPMSYINPSDIESISILRDADATAIYGSRAANGAILITTKRGHAGRTKIAIDLQSGVGRVPKFLDLLNTKQYLVMRHEALNLDGISNPSATDYDINGVWDTTQYTNWQKSLIGKSAQYSTMNGSITGGNTAVQYLLSGTYHVESTVFPWSFGDHKGAVHFTLNTASENQKFKVQLSSNYVIDNNQLPSTDLTNLSNQLAPDAPKLYKADGTLNWAPNANGTSTWTNPLSYLYQRYTNKTNNLISDLQLSYQILRGLEVKSNFGYTSLQYNEILVSPIATNAPELRPTSQRYAFYTNGSINSWIIEPQLSYKTQNWLNSKLEVLAGSTIQQNNSNAQEVLGLGFSSDQLLQDIQAASSLITQPSSAAEYKYGAVFGRINYQWKSKYIIDLNARRDGSSRFGSANQFNDFGAIGAAWVFSSENFFKKTVPGMDFGKLRMNYGTTGNDQIGDYKFLNLYNPIGGLGTPYQNIASLQPSGLSNPYLQWELTKKLQFGLDLGVFHDQLLVTVNYFRNRSSNELLSYQLPVITGFSGITLNFPAVVENSGWEASIHADIIKSKVFNWAATFNMTVPSNKLVSFPNLATSTYANSLVIGQPITAIKAYHYHGVNPSTGLYSFSDGHGGTTSRPDTNFKTTETDLINTTPKYYGGLENIISYKGFELSFLIQFVNRIGPKYYYGGLFAPGYRYENQPNSVLNSWSISGDNKPIQRYNSNNAYSSTFSDIINSNAGYANDYYIRVKNAVLSYELPKNWLRAIHLLDTRVYAQAQNLLTFTPYKGLDPETLSNVRLPTLLTITGGIQISFE